MAYMNKTSTEKSSHQVPHNPNENLSMQNRTTNPRIESKSVVCFVAGKKD